jgi:hypothetical protein
MCEGSEWFECVSVCGVNAGPVDRASWKPVAALVLRWKAGARRDGGASRGSVVHGGGDLAADSGRRNAVPYLPGHGVRRCRWPALQLAQLLQQAQPYAVAALARLCHRRRPDRPSSGLFFTFSVTQEFSTSLIQDFFSRAIALVMCKFKENVFSALYWENALEWTI